MSFRLGLRLTRAHQRQLYRNFSSTPAKWGLPGLENTQNGKLHQEKLQNSTGSAGADTQNTLENLSESIVDTAKSIPEGVAHTAESIAEAGQHLIANPETATQTFTLANGIASGTLDLTSLATSYGIHPIMRLQSMLLNVHESFPFVGYTPWYIVIPSTTLAVRLLLFWFQVRSQRNAAKMAVLQPQMLEFMERMKAAKKTGDIQAQQGANLQIQQLFRKHGVNPLTSVTFPLAQGAVFMTMFFAIRGLAESGLLSLTTEGLAWFKDLSKADPYYILPLTSMGLTMLTIETGMASTPNSSQNNQMRLMKGVLRVVLPLSTFFIAYFPTALLMYWTTNNAISLLQTTILKIPGVKKFFNIPTPPPALQPGDPGFVKPPSFMEAFRNMQLETIEKAHEKARADQIKQMSRAALSTSAQSISVPPTEALKPSVTKIQEIEASSIETKPTEANLVKARAVKAKPVKSKPAEFKTTSSKSRSPKKPK